MRDVIERRAALACAGAALLIALGGGAYVASGAPPISGGAVTGCVAKHGGTLRVVRRGRHCPRGTVRVTLGTSGAPGGRGPTGPTGPAGPPNPDAKTVGGETVTKLFLKEPTPATTMAIKTLFSGAGLVITGDCDNAGNASLVANGPASADADLSYLGATDGFPSFKGQVNALGPASNITLGSPHSGEVTFAYAAAGGQTVTGTIGWQTAPSLGAFNGCAFFGTAISG